MQKSPIDHELARLGQFRTSDMHKSPTYRRVRPMAHFCMWVRLRNRGRARRPDPIPLTDAVP